MDDEPEYYPEDISKVGASEERMVYSIKIQGALKPEWSEWFNGMQIVTYEQGDGPVTLLTGNLSDQTALRGILNRIWNLNLTLLSVIYLGNLSSLESKLDQPVEEVTQGRDQ